MAKHVFLKTHAVNLKKKLLPINHHLKTKILKIIVILHAVESQSKIKRLSFTIVYRYRYKLHLNLVFYMRTFLSHSKY